jgi:hypothetical protein
MPRDLPNHILGTGNTENAARFLLTRIGKTRKGRQARCRR